MNNVGYEVLNEEYNSDDIEVNITCLTYNHKNFIAKTLDSFLMQKTTFKYRIYVHDDASTDGTAEILREYANKYPNEIVVILQRQNQYSQKVRISQTYIYPLCKGRYNALCEGDDYWIDDQKLQKQYDYMEAHPECALCAHGGISVDAKTQKPFNKVIYSNKETVCSIKDAIAGFGRDILTNSFFFKNEICYIEPEFRRISPCGDYVIPIVSALNGTVAYLPDIMSAYRVTSNAKSVTTQMRSNNAFRKTYTERYDLMLSSMDEYTEHKYSDVIAAERTRIWMNYYIQIRDKAALRSKEYQAILRKYSLKRRVLLFAELNLPRIVAYLREVKKQRRLKKTKEIIDIHSERTSKWFAV